MMIVWLIVAAVVLAVLALSIRIVKQYDALTRSP